MFIYVITNEINGKQYVGQTIRSVQTRFKEHLKCYTNNYLSKGIKKYGIDSFVVEKIDIAKSQEELDNLEKSWIKKLNTLAPYGYNLTIGGQGGFKSRESRSNFVENRKGDLNHNSVKVINITENKVFNSIIEASVHYNVGKDGISHCCRGKQKTAYGYNWAFYEDYLNGEFKISPTQERVVVNLDTGDKYNSIKEAAEFYNTYPSTITAVCRGYKYNKTAGGYRWSYYDKQK